MPPQTLVSQKPLAPDYEPSKQQMPEGYLPLRDELEHITRKMYTQNLALVQTNRTLSILRAIDLLILEPGRSLQHLSTDVSRAIIDASPYSVTGILSLSRHSDHFINMQGLAYSKPFLEESDPSSYNFLENLYMSLDNGWLSSRQRNFIVALDNTESLSQLEVNGFGEGIGQAMDQLRKNSRVRSFYFTKLYARNNLNGVIMIGLQDPMPKINDIELFERLSEPAGIALDNRLLFEENQRFLLQLQTSNNHLKDLDLAKDEFISLVSHQLRTPLTSIKGLLSLVLDGDAGEVNEQQRKMLQQAFNSSQRMVYLIADLLNASRLQSGKFMIMNRLTYLPDVVETELTQLTETAAARNVKLYFDKPADFPKLMLDETKIRQVIMNFLDNAMYYTQSGGWIKVGLKATDKTIEYTVTDNGLGVPKGDASNLFTKFFRAPNARKMRPEGTGLGLYMAKKVVVAQGGAIIFNSVENKGSVFGFSFPREKVEATPEQMTATG